MTEDRLVQDSTGQTVRDVLTISTPVVLFLAFCSTFFWFVLDDAYITLRYSRHLAAGKGILWNTGTSQAMWMNPVEGYTSTLWVLIGAVPHWLGVDPVLFVKVVSVLSMIAVMVVLFVFGKRENVDNYVLAPALATIGVSPAVALITVQGMETAVAALFVCMASLSAIQFSKTHRDRWAISVCTFLLLGMLTRPGLVVFAAGLLAALFAVLYSAEKRSRAVRLTVYGVLVLFIPGIVFLVSRRLYFGYWLPNSFYIKESSRLITLSGGQLVFEFLTVVLGPVSFVGLLLASMKGEREIRKEVVRIAPIMSGVVLFLSIWFFISPIQGYLWRFQIPALPALLIVIVYLCREYDVSTSRRSVTRLLLVVLVLGMVFYPLHTLDQSIRNVDQRDQTSRVVAGQSLDELDSDYKMFVTESGALPYYSNWIAVDELGLNSERIAHDGLSQQFLQEYDPDMVMMAVQGRPGMIQVKSPETARYLDGSTYRLVAAVQKTERDPRYGYHLYFVDRESDGYREITCALSDMDGVSYVDEEYFVEASDIDIRETEITRQDCGG